MEARKWLVALAVICGASMVNTSAWGASARSRHFLVKAPTQAQATRIAEAAEQFRRDLAIEWLGRELPPWPDVCPIVADVAPNNPAGGATSFIFQGGQPRAWQMSVQGTEERVLDSVLPHEITHTIFATHFGQPLPRWADEGACTTVEHESEIAKHKVLLNQFLRTSRGIPFNRMFAMRDYPRDILPLYAQGHSLANFLIQQGGKRKYIEFVEDGLTTNRWPEAVQRHYGFPDLSELQLTWVEWVREGEPPVDQFDDERLVEAQRRVGGDNLLAARNRPTTLASRREREPNPRDIAAQVNTPVRLMERDPDRGDFAKRSSSEARGRDLTAGSRPVRPAAAVEELEPIDVEERPRDRTQLAQRELPRRPISPKERPIDERVARDTPPKSGGYYARRRRSIETEEREATDVPENEMRVASRPMPPQSVGTKVLEWQRGGERVHEGVAPLELTAPVNRFRRVPADGTVDEEGVGYDAPIGERTVRR